MNAMTVIGLLVAVLPASLLVTFALFPFWGWLERTTGIESLGHSGPAEWCYLAVYLITVTGTLLLFFLRGKTRKR